MPAYPRQLTPAQYKKVLESGVPLNEITHATDYVDGDIDQIIDNTIANYNRNKKIQKISGWIALGFTVLVVALPAILARKSS